jgi:hypothetical protein
MNERPHHIVTPGGLAAMIAGVGDGPGIVAAMIPGCLVFCEGVLVGRAVEGPRFELVCDDPRHGVHPRYEELAARICGMLARMKVPAADAEPCPKCGGVGFLTGSAASQVVLMALTFKMYRGVALPAGLELLGQVGDLQAPTAGDRFAAILPRPAPVDCPSKAPATYPEQPANEATEPKAPQSPTNNGGDDGNHEEG